MTEDFENVINTIDPYQLMLNLMVPKCAVKKVGYLSGNKGQFSMPSVLRMQVPGKNYSCQRECNQIMRLNQLVHIHKSIYLICNTQFLEQFHVNKEVERKVQRYPIYPLPHTCIAFLFTNIPNQLTRMNFKKKTHKNKKTPRNNLL